MALNKNLSMFCDWFLDYKISIHFDENKAKTILFCSKHKSKNSKPLNIQCIVKIKIKQYSVTLK